MYLPAVHLVQDPPSGPLDPLLHVQALRASLPDGDDDREGQLEHMLDVGAPKVVEYVPISQSMHVLDIVAPTAVEYVQISQLLHVAGPVIALYFPATHSEHVPPSGPVEPASQTQSDR